MNNISQICAALNLKPRTLIEFGAAHPRTQRLGYFIERGHNVILVEANPRLYYCLTEGFEEGDFQTSWPHIPPPPHRYSGFKSYPNVKVIHAAIAATPGKVKVYERNASSFVGGINSPAKINDGYLEDDKDAYEVEAVTIGQLDNGEIDVLLADVEGSEWFCLNGLKSRPKMIMLELFGWQYINPYIECIMDWMKQNGYTIIDRDDTDVLFVRQ